MPIGKTLRFEIFARDSFTCQYCGIRPPDVVLEVDHIHPVSKGGSDDSINLTTACFECNRGKRAKVITDIAPRPDADLKYLQVMQEAAEVGRYLKAQKKLDAAINTACDFLIEQWQREIGSDVAEEREIVRWIKRYGPQEVQYAISAAGRAHARKKFGWAASPRKVCPYIGAILRDRETESEVDG